MPDALPYHVPPDDAIRAGTWTTESNGTRARLPSWIEDWDISRRLRASREVEIDLDATYGGAQLDENAVLGLTVVAVSDFEHGAVARRLERSTDTLVTTLALDVAGDLLGKTVDLVTNLVLQKGTPNASRPIAWRRGSVLWSDTTRVNLYGAESQFPVSEVDFELISRDPAAPWFLELGPDPELPAMGSIHLLVNRRFPLVCEALRAEDPERRELAVIRSELFADVGRTLIEAALALDEAAERWPEDSLGAALANLLASRLDESQSELRILREQDPSMWAAMMASTFGRLREPL